MRLAFAGLCDSGSARVLVSELMHHGCVADQLVIVTEEFEDPVASDDCSDDKPSLIPVWHDNKKMLWAVREPEFYASGIRDEQAFIQGALASIDQYDHAVLRAARMSSTSVTSLRNPLVILQLNTDQQEARAQVHVLIRFAWTPVEILGSPRGVFPDIGSIETVSDR